LCHPSTRRRIEPYCLAMGNLVYPRRIAFFAAKWEQSAFQSAESLESEL
jgi:hypothetical protein